MELESRWPQRFRLGRPYRHPFPATERTVGDMADEWKHSPRSRGVGKWPFSGTGLESSRAAVILPQNYKKVFTRRAGLSNGSFFLRLGRDWFPEICWRGQRSHLVWCSRLF